MSTLPPALKWKVTATMDAVTAMFEATYPGEWGLADFANGVTLSGGYKDALGAVDVVDVFTSGIIESVRVIYTPQGPTTEVKGRDAGFTLTDNVSLIQFLTADALASPVLPLGAPIQGGLNPHVSYGVLPPPPAGWSRVTATDAAQCCAAILGSAPYFGTWNYAIFASFTASGHKIDTIRQLLGPQSVAEVSKPYIWHRYDGVFVIAPLGLGGAADWDLDASEWLLNGELSVSETWGPRYAHYLLTGGPDVSFIGDVYRANAQPTTSTVWGWDETGVIVSMSTSVTVGRPQDGATESTIRTTWGPDPDNPNRALVELSFELTKYLWEAPMIGSRFQLLNRPVLFSQATWSQTRTLMDNGLYEMRPSQFSVVGQNYDVFKVSTGAATLSRALDPVTGESTGTTLSVEHMNRVLNFTLRTLLSPDAIGSQAFLSGGLPPGGAGTNAQLPACLREAAPSAAGWTDVEYGNPNLSQEDLDTIVNHLTGETGKVKGEVAFSIAALPQLHHGDMATVRNLPLPDGSRRTFRGQVVSLTTKYGEAEGGGLLQDVTLRYWR